MNGIIGICEELLNAQHLKSAQVCSNTAQMKCDSLKRVDANVPVLFFLASSEENSNSSVDSYYDMVLFDCTDFLSSTVLFSLFIFEYHIMMEENKMTLVLKHLGIWFVLMWTYEHNNSICIDPLWHLLCISSCKCIQWNMMQHLFAPLFTLA